MIKQTIRFEDEVYERLKALVGQGSINAFVVDLVMKSVGMTKDAEPGPPVRLGMGRELNEAVVAEITDDPETKAKVRRILQYLDNLPPNATEEGQPADLKGYLCGAMTGAGQCSKPAWKWQGDAARCREH